MPRAGLDREAVVDAAVELADRDGFEALTLAALAQKLNIRTPSLYNHVDGLPGLRRALALRGVHALTDAARRAAVGKSGADAVMAIAHAFRGVMKAHPGLYAATIQPARYRLQPDDPEIDAASRETIDVVLAALSAYRLEPEEALHAVRGLRSVVHGFTSLELADGFRMPFSIDESFQRLVQMYINGLEHRYRQSMPVGVLPTES